LDAFDARGAGTSKIRHPFGKSIPISSDSPKVKRNDFFTSASQAGWLGPQFKIFRYISIPSQPSETAIDLFGGIAIIIWGHGLLGRATTSNSSDLGRRMAWITHDDDDSFKSIRHPSSSLFTIRHHNQPTSSIP
jgi:hypothetical protein